MWILEVELRRIGKVSILEAPTLKSFGLKSSGKSWAEDDFLMIQFEL